MWKLVQQALTVSPTEAAVLIFAVYQLLRLSLQATVQPRISARTRVHIFISAVAYLVLLFVAALLILLVLQTAR